MSLRSWVQSFISPDTRRARQGSQSGLAATKFRPRGESLESRLNMAGNIVATVSGGTLFITGDTLANEVRIEGVTAGTVEVSGLSATKVNGVAGAEFTARNIQNIFMEMGNGDDKATFVLTDIKGLLRFNGSNGNDSLLFGEGNSGTNSFGSLAATMAAGDDTLGVDAAETSFRVPGTVTLSGGEGANTTDFGPLNLVLGATSYTGGNGFDRLGLGGEDAAATVTTGSLSFNGGNGDNSFALGAGTVNGGISIIGGKNSDDFSTQSNHSLRINGSVTAMQGDGQNSIGFFHSETTFITGLVTVIGGANDDQVGLIQVDALAASLSLGAGGNSVGLVGVIHSNLSISTLGGADRIDSSDLDVYGATLISTGEGVDVVDLSNSRFRSVVTILTAGGADRVSLECDMSARLGDRITQFDSTVTIDLGAGDDILEIGISDAVQPGEFNPDVFATFAFPLVANGGLGKDTLTLSPFNRYAFRPTFVSFP